MSFVFLKFEKKQEQWTFSRFLATLAWLLTNELCHIGSAYVPLYLNLRKHRYEQKLGYRQLDQMDVAAESRLIFKD